ASGKELGQIDLGVSGGFGDRGVGVVAMGFGPGARFLALRHLQGKVGLYEVPSGKLLRTLEIPAEVPQFGKKQDSPLRHSFEMIVPGDGKLLAAVASPNTLGLWDVTTGRQVGSLPLPHGKQFEGGKFSPDGRCLALDVVSSPASKSEGPIAVVPELTTGTA